LTPRKKKLSIEELDFFLIGKILPKTRNSQIHKLSNIRGFQSPKVRKKVLVKNAGFFTFGCSV